MFYYFVIYQIPNLFSYYIITIATLISTPNIQVS